ncbi:MAG: hypothetical protein IRZ32_08780 [Solirubrobacteraceae bacterium]|nr:hypothetical protein [Solirubrobacteraceae bacterium]
MRLRDPELRKERAYPQPLLAVEVAPWTRPSGSVAFSTHPYGAEELHSQAWALLRATGVASQLSKTDVQRLGAECWRIAGVVFTPGVAIRSALDAAVEGGSLRPRVYGPIGGGMDGMQIQRLAHLATWAVFRAACDLAAASGKAAS